jgi:hypothetical protein
MYFQAIAIEVKHDDKLDEQDGVLVQTAMLYTSCSGQRRVRILNLSLRSSGQMGELYRSCDLDTIMNFFGKQGMLYLFLWYRLNSLNCFLILFSYVQNIGKFWTTSKGRNY